MKNANPEAPMLRTSARNVARIAQAALTRDVPVYAHFGITHRCNLTCKMCGIWRYGDEREELSIPQIREIAQRMARLGVVQVSIGGGEPFAVAHLEEAARCFVEAGLNIRVLTNGIGPNIRERIDRCIDAGVRNFSISLDSLYPARFDWICEKEGSWDEAVRTMAHVGNRLHGVPGSMPTINCVVSNVNLEELPDMARFARAIGFGISFLPVELLPDPKAGVQNFEARFIRYRPDMGVYRADSREEVTARVNKAYDALIAMKAEGYPILNSTPYLESSRRYLTTGRFPAEGCDAGRLYFSVAPNGQFTICHRTIHQHLSFLDPGFEEYFHSAVYEQKRMMEAGACEGCMRACWIDTSAMFRTMRGFFETTVLALRPRPERPLTWDEARAWARTEDVPIVPEMAGAQVPA